MRRLSESETLEISIALSNAAGEARRQSKLLDAPWFDGQAARIDGLRDAIMRGQLYLIHELEEAA